MNGRRPPWCLPVATRGFSLVELAVALVALGLIAVLVMTLVPWITDRMRLDDTSVELAEIRKTLDGYAIANHHLPCPDTSGDGLENRDGDGLCVEVVGGVPYLDLSLAELARDEALLPLRYGVYRSATTDLTVLSQLFQPNLPDSLTITPGTVSGCSSDGDLVLIVYDSQASTVFRVQSSAGFEEGEYIGLGIMDYDNLATDPDASPCPCGGAAPSCTVCTVFPDGQVVEGLNSGNLATVSSTTIVGPPGPFHSTYPALGFAMPEPIRSTTPEGITADGLGFTRLLARITAIDGNDLSVEVLDSISSSGFLVGQTITGTGGGQATVTSVAGVTINAEVVSGTFTSGETVTNGTSNATVNQVNPPNYLAEVVTGTIDEGETLTQANTGATVSVLSAEDTRVDITLDGGSPTPAVGDSITGGTSGASGVVTSVSGASVTGFIQPGPTFQASEGVSISPSGATGTVTNVVRRISGQVTSGTLNTTDELVGTSGTAEIIHAVTVATITATESGLVGNAEFEVGMRVHGGSSGANSVITEIIPPTAGMFAVGETVSTGTGSGVVQSRGLSWVLLDGVTGSFSVGQDLSGTTPGAGGEIIDVRLNQTTIPTASPGSITRTPNTSTALNNLDFCQNLRNAHSETILTGTGSTSVVHTVSPDGPMINPAYLLVSGGVEDAAGDGDDVAFDGRNRLVPILLDFESPGRLRGPAYDDIVATMPVEQLEQRLQCAVNIGAVNAKAANATTMKNNALLAFYLNEQAIRNVEVSYQAWQMAETNLIIAIFQLTLDTISTALSLYKDLMYSEGAVGKKAFETAQFAIALARGIAETAIGISDIVSDAEDSVAGSKATFEAACEAQVATQAALADADVAAGLKLQEALRIDQVGGVR